jgi:hypothetical protein
MFKLGVRPFFITALLFLVTTQLKVFANVQPKFIVDAAIGSVDVTPPVGVPLAGHGSIQRRNLIPFKRWFEKYATYFKPSEGVLDPIRVKAMLLRNGDKKLLFVSVDLVAVTDEFRGQLADRLKGLGFDRNEILVSGTHTHNGPGAITSNPVWELVAVDKFKPEIYNKLFNSWDWKLQAKLSHFFF